MSQKEKVYLLAICLVLSVIIEKQKIDAQSSEAEWWQHANFYQIYPRSYKDSDNDGSGDLKGITEKLDYLNSIGVQNIWLSPIMESPMVDAGYDISDYRQINEIFGTMKDFDDLLEKAHSLGMRVILDLVPNHTSDQHVWFYKSVLRMPGYENYYVWADAKGETTLENGTIVKEPPNNWISVFANSAWEWNEIRGQFYLHQFAIAQPDLNYRDTGVVNEIKNVMRYWLDKGVDGFRVDAIPFLFESANLEDEAPNPDGGRPGIDYTSLHHNLTLDLPETYDMIYQFRDVCKEYTDRPRVMMTEAYTTLENTIKYYGNETHDGASFTFNFFLLTDLKSNSTATAFKDVIDKWLGALTNPKYTSNWVMGNHDNNRTATRQGVGRIDGINMLVNILPGVGVTYNGEEIGMENGAVSWDETQDPSAINLGQDHYWEVSRDFERTPFHWDSSVNAGFNNGTKTWLPVSNKYTETNVILQENNNKSHLNIFKHIMALRNESIVKNGKLVVTALNQDVLTVAREVESEGTILLVFNLNGNQQQVTLKTTLASLNLTDTMVVKIPSSASSRNYGDEVQVNVTMDLAANEALVLENSAVNGALSVTFSLSVLMLAIILNIM